MNNNRGLTLLELLIAVALVLTIGALLTPMMMDRLEERTFESAADVTSEQLMLARAHAQTTGNAVEVTYNAQTSRVEARLFTPLLQPTSASNGESGLNGFPFYGQSGHRADSKRHSGPAGSRIQESLDDTGMSPAEVDDQALAIAEDWASRALAPGLKFVMAPPRSVTAADQSDDSDDQFALDDRSQADYETLEDLAGGGQAVRLAVFMPDGSALPGEPVWLGDASGRWGMLTVNPWSGLPLFQRVEPKQADGPAAADEAQTLADDSSEDRSPRSRQPGDQDADADDDFTTAPADETSGADGL